MSFANTSVTLQNQLQTIKSRLLAFSIPYVDGNIQNSAELKSRWKEALRELKKIRIIAYDYRQFHLKATLLLYEEQFKNPDPTSDIEAIETRVKTRRHLIRIEFLRGPFVTLQKTVGTTQTCSSITKLLIPCSSKNNKTKARFCLPDGSISESQLLKMAQFDKRSVNYKTILNPKKMEKELLTHNDNWFRQAAETPFGHGDFYDYVGFDGLTPGRQLGTEYHGDRCSTFQKNHVMRPTMKATMRPTMKPNAE